MGSNVSVKVQRKSKIVSQKGNRIWRAKGKNVQLKIILRISSKCRIEIREDSVSLTPCGQNRSFFDVLADLL